LGPLIGTGVATNSIENALSLNRELGVSVLYEFEASPYQLILNSMWSRRSLSGILAFYSNSQTNGYYALKPIYGAFENTLEVSYRWKESPKGNLFIYGE
jgi:hypothetical protein